MIYMTMKIATFLKMPISTVYIYGQYLRSLTQLLGTCLKEDAGGILPTHSEERG